jgi:hypothetical protein
MKGLTFRKPNGWLLSILFFGFFLSLVLYKSAGAHDRPDGTQQSSVVNFMPPSSGRHFYLTNVDYTPNTATTACTSGYHMASLWEILDVSNLTYDYNHPAATTKADSGYGPPSFWYGWVRTGGDSSGSSTTGIGNCLNWTSVSASDYGVSIRLSQTWKTAPGDIFTWNTTSFSCDTIGPVWCVGDFSIVYLPLVKHKH